MNADLENRFEFHPALSGEKRQQHATVRGVCRELAENLDALLPNSREKSLAFTAVEEAMMWANAAVARN